MAITIGIKKIICLDDYPETDFDLIKESGVTIELLDKDKIQYWAKTLLNL
jgi:dCMP deaminase